LTGSDGDAVFRIFPAAESVEVHVVMKLQSEDPQEKMSAIGYPTFEGILRESYMTMSYADMVIDCSDGTVPCHRTILAAASPFLHPLLRDYNPIESHRILLPDVCVSTMKHVLSILYIGQTYSPSVDDFREIFEVIKLLGIDFECDLYNRDKESGSKTLTWQISSIGVIYPDVTPELVHQPSPKQVDHYESHTPEEPSLEGEVSDAGDQIDEISEAETVIDDVIQIMNEDEVILESEAENEAEFFLPTQTQTPLSMSNLNTEDNWKPKILKISTQESSTGIRPSNSEQRIHNIRTIPLKTQSTFQKRRIQVSRTEAADVIQEMIRSGQLCLAPGPAFGAQRITSNRTRNNDSAAPINPTNNRNRLVFQNIPQNFVKFSPENGFLNPKTQETLQHPPEVVEEGQTLMEEEAPAYVIHGNVYNSYLDIHNVDSEPFPEAGGVSNPGCDPNYEKEEDDYSMTPEEILNAAKISSQKDHAYANFDQNKKRPKSKTKPPKLPKVVQM